MKFEDGWYWPDREIHMLQWVADPRNRLILNGRPAYQGKKQECALNLCRGTAMRTAIDVGAHCGTWAYNLAAAFLTVRCFEPILVHRECLALNVAAPNVYVMPIALGDRSGMTRMRENASSTGDTWVEPGANDGDVRIERLDSFEYHDVDFIKIDTEGFEESVLRGAEETIRQCKPVICIEQKRDMPSRYGMKPQGAVAWLQNRGYVVSREIGGDFFMIPADD